VSTYIHEANYILKILSSGIVFTECQVYVQIVGPLQNISDEIL
jgi:hypothetical protein